MADTSQPKTLVEDLRRILPVLVIVLATGITVSLSMRIIAIGHLREASASHPDACKIADVSVAAGRRLMPSLREEALRLRKETPSEFPESSRGILKDDPNLKVARDHFLRAHALCPTNIETVYYLAILDWYADRVADSHFHLGYTLYMDKKPDEAITQFRVALSAEPDHTQALLHLGLALRDSGRLFEAMDLIAPREEAIAKEKDTLSILGRLYAATDDKAKAMDYLEKALLERPSDMQAIDQLSRLYREVGESKRGATFLLALKDSDQRTVAPVFANAAIMFSDIEDWKNEEVALREAIRLFSNSAELYFKLAVNLKRQGKKSEARDMLRRAMEHDMARTTNLIKASGINPAE